MNVIIVNLIDVIGRSRRDHNVSNSARSRKKSRLHPSLGIYRQLAKQFRRGGHQSVIGRESSTVVNHYIERS